MSENSSSKGSAGGVGFPSLLTLLFIGLKLTHVIEWSWVWVLSSLWIAAIVFIIIVTISVVMRVI